MARLVDTAKAETARLQSEGIDSTLFDTALSRAKRDGHLMLGAGSWHAHLVDTEIRGGDAALVLKRPGILATLTVEMLNAAPREYLTADNVREFVFLSRASPP